MEWAHMSQAPVEDDLCTRIRRSEQALMGHHEAVLRAYGLTMTQYTELPHSAHSWSEPPPC